MKDIDQTRASASDELQRRIVEKIRHELGSQIRGPLEQHDNIKMMVNTNGSLWIERLEGI